jgi:hypothetical protein
METTTTPLSDREQYFQARIEVLEKQLKEAKELNESVICQLNEAKDILSIAMSAMEVSNFEIL